MAKYLLKLYVIGSSSLTKKAIHNLKSICENPKIKKKYSLKIIDLLKHPEWAEKEKIIATPVLIKELPEPLRRIIGDMSNHQNVLVGLDISEE